MDVLPEHAALCTGPGTVVGITGFTVLALPSARSVASIVQTHLDDCGAIVTAFIPAGTHPKMKIQAIYSVSSKIYMCKCCHSAVVAASICITSMRPSY